MKPPIGHQTATQLLQSAIAQKTHYNFLIQGADGIGKGALAKWAASLFLGTDRLSGHPDLLEIVTTIKKDKVLVPSPEGIIRMEQLKVDELSLQPVKAPYRVVIIYDAHKAGSNFNALLKTMEDRVVFILVTDQPQLLLDTIRSRCLNISCTKLNEVDMTQVLSAISPHTLGMEWLLKMVPGQPGRAIMIHQHLNAIGATLLGRIEGAVVGAPEYELMQVAGLIAAQSKPIQLSLLAILEYLCWQMTHEPAVLGVAREGCQQLNTLKSTQLAWYLLLSKLSGHGKITIPLVQLPAVTIEEEIEPRLAKSKSKRKGSASVPIPTQGKQEEGVKSTARGGKQETSGQRKVKQATRQVDLLSL